MLIQGQVGQPSTTSITPGTTPTIRQGQLGDVIVSELHGRYYETTYRRNQFTAATQAGVTTSAGLATATTGLILTNPTTSTVNCVVNKVGYAFIAAPAALIVVGMAFNTSTTAVTQTTAITPRNMFLGGAAPQGLAASSVTLPTAGIISHIFGQVTWITGGTGSLLAPVTNFVDLEGSMVLPPGSYCHIYTSTASSASGFFGSISWEEVPV